MDNNIVVYDGELTHWGIRGMRWGIRRYQNKDGSLTPAGKKKLRAEQAKVREQEAINKNRKATQAKIERLNARKKAAADDKRALDEAEGKKVKKPKNSDVDAKKPEVEEVKDTPPKKKSLKDMTDAELAAAINRSRLENEYNRLQSDQTKQNQPSQQGQQAVQSAQKSGFMKKMWDEAAVPAMVQGGRNLLTTAMNKGVEKMFKEQADPNSLEVLEKVAKKAKAQFEKLDYETKMDKINNPDKYLNEDEKTKRRDREVAQEDREAQKRGYKDAVDEANQKRIAKESADASARAANEAISKEYYDRGYAYSKAGSNKAQSSTVSVGENTISKGHSAIIDRGTMSSLMGSSWDQRSSNPSTVALGERTVAGYLGSGSSTPVLALPAPKDDD